MNSVKSPVTLVSVFSVEPNKQRELVDLLRENTETVIKTLDGWIATDVIVSADGGQVIIRSQWESDAHIAAMRADSRMLPYVAKIRELASFDSTAGTTVVSHHR